MAAVNLAWQANGSCCAVAVAAHRAAAAGCRVAADGGDYQFAEPLVADRLAAALGLDLSAPAARAEGGIHLPRIALFTGTAAGYPYYAYYAHCLLSLGLTYQGVDGAAIASGALDQADLLVIPGGFAIWGLDQAEAVTGADRAVRQFLQRGGAAIGSCGGAFYLSAGRGQWTGTAMVKPTYTHEYLQTGAAVVNVQLRDPVLAQGCPAQLEVAYYHGPAYPQAGANTHALATFAGLSLPSRLFIDNPLERARFEHDLAGRPAALLASGAQGRAVLFSPHPEMGDLVRKYIALDGYVRHYLPLRGRQIMDQTLRFYAPDDAPAFRLVLNAARLLDAFSAGGTVPVAAAAASRARCRTALARLDAGLGTAVAGLRVALQQSGEEGEWAALVAAEIERQQVAWRRTFNQFDHYMNTRQSFLDDQLLTEVTRLFEAASASLATLAGQPLMQALALCELPLRLLTVGLRIVRCDQAVRTQAVTA